MGQWINAGVAIAALLGFAGCSLPEDADYRPDVAAICEAMPKQHAYFGDRAAAWDAACAQAEAEMTLNATPAQVLTVLERLTDALYDPHVSLNVNSATSPRLVPSGLDMWFEGDGEGYVLTGLRPHSGAAASDLELGDKLVRFNGLTPDELLMTRIHAGEAHLPQARKIWALHAALAGNRGEPRQIEVARRGQVLSVALGDPEPASQGASLRYRILRGNIGYVRLHDSLGDADTAEAFDGIMASLGETDALILDLRDTPGGGSTDVAEPILGHFIQERQGYQMVLPIGKKPYLREVDPVAHHNYDKPLIVLVGRWTGSMGEGMAVGLDAMGRALIMGDKMAGLAGGVETIDLKLSGIGVRYPAYGLSHIDGTPRQDWAPSPRQRADFGDGDDLLLQAARAQLKAR
jgi:carboxyl-terminal processing protease